MEEITEDGTESGRDKTRRKKREIFIREMWRRQRRRCKVVIIIANVNEMHLDQVVCASGQGTNDVAATLSTCRCLPSPHHSVSP